jgi:hypothetical protein
MRRNSPIRGARERELGRNCWPRSGLSQKRKERLRRQRSGKRNGSGRLRRREGVRKEKQDEKLSAMLNVSETTIGTEKGIESMIEDSRMTMGEMTLQRRLLDLRLSRSFLRKRLKGWSRKLWPNS